MLGVGREYEYEYEYEGQVKSARFPAAFIGYVSHQTRRRRSKVGHCAVRDLRGPSEAADRVEGND
jgi:hypothetical protein